MTQMTNFRVLEVTGATKSEALDNAPFKTVYDATQAFKNWKKKQTGAITDSAVKQFCAEYLAKKTKFVEGLGCYITVEAAVSNTKVTPCKITNVKSEKPRKFKTVHMIVDDETGNILGQVEGKKTDASKLMKEIYETGEYKGNCKCKRVKQVSEGEETELIGTYCPSKSAKPGVYKVFGVERD